MIQTNVLVVGAGPAGTTCAYLLKKAGVDCLLIDQATFPRDKICGGGLTSKTWHLIERLMPGFEYDYNPANNIRLSMDGKAQCEICFNNPIRIVQRKNFDHALLQQYLSIDGKFQQDALLQVEEKNDGHIIASLKSGESITCQYLIGADGSNSRVRRYLTSSTDRGVLILEQYGEKGIQYQMTNFSPLLDKQRETTIDIFLSSAYDKSGYFYRFPNHAYDVVGFGDNSTTPEKFRRVMQEQGFPDGKTLGTYLYLSNDYPLKENIILIGDAGGFANRVTWEGLYNAFRTAQNAAEAIIRNRSFRETNAAVFQRMRYEDTAVKIFYSKFGYALVRWLCHHPTLIKKIIDKKLEG